MEKMFWTSVLLCSVQFVASQGFGGCGRPVVYADRRLDEKYAALSEFKNVDKVAYKCTTGYTPYDGKRVIYCRNGQWDTLTLKCQKKQCSSAGEIINGRFVHQGISFGDKAYATCDDGYVLHGERVRECLENGTWNGTLPTCEKGSRSASAPPLSPSLFWTFLHRAELPTCRRPAAIKNGKFNESKDAYNPGQSLSISCDVGYKLKGRFNIRCQSDGTWKPDLPQCEASPPPLSPSPALDRAVVKTCRPPGLRKNMKFRENKNAYKPGESLSISCDAGYNLNGSFSIKCQPNGTWMPKLSKCNVIKCPKLNIVNGQVSTSYMKLNTTATISCENGFQLRGPNPITCAANGSWAPSVPSCVSPNCDRPPYHPNAMPREDFRQDAPYKSGDYVRFKCNLGYRWVGGSVSVQCDNGRWTPLKMMCERKSCGSAGEILNGRFKYTGISFGDTATAECDEGHFLVGRGVRHCLSEGWDGRVPVCEVIQCFNPPEVPGAEIIGLSGDTIQYRHVVSYRCLSGSLIGAQDIYCTEHGNWSAPPPTCRNDGCPDPDVMFGSKIYGAYRRQHKIGDVVMFTCNPGYKLEGSGVVTCGVDGTWTPSLPDCVWKSARRG